jgi:bifunctional DNA-binding transcriptional regulator/antitoxin component of YhaV-PrlF toxin-antitoxin module
MLEEKLKIGKKGEIFTTKKIREALGLYPGTYVSASVVRDKLVVRRIPNLDELLKNFYAEVSWEEVEKLSEAMQKRIREDKET